MSVTEEDTIRFLKIYCQMNTHLGTTLGMAEGLKIQAEEQIDKDQLERVTQLCTEALIHLQAITKRVGSKG